MGLYKRRNPDGSLNPVWQIGFEHAGRTYRRSSKTADKRLAEAAERKFKSEVYRRAELGERSYTWEDGLRKWFVEKADKRSLLRDRQISEYLAKECELAGSSLDEIDDNIITGVKALLLRDKREPSTRNRYLAWLRAFLRACKRWRMVTRDIPAIEIPKPPRKFYPSITKPMVARVFEALAPHLRPIALFALATGLRRGNVLGLRWERVNLSQRTAVVPGSERKQGTTHTIQLNALAVSILEAQRGAHPEFVFPDHKGRAPIKNIKTGWNAACRRAEVRFTFRMLRRTWATWHILNGTPAQVVKELGGWQTMAMVELYSEQAGNYAKDWANNVKAEVS